MVTPTEAVRVEVYNEAKWIVAVCSFCGRWRDSCHQWIIPPKVVEALVDAQIIGLSHTYCVDCIRGEAVRETENGDERLGRMYSKQADREEQRAKEAQGRDYHLGDIVHNLTLGILPSGKEFNEIEC